MSKNNTIIHFITSLGEGGAESTLYKLLKTTKNNFNHVVINLNNNQKYSNYIRELGISVINLDIKKNSISKVFLIFKILNNYKKKKIIVQTWLYHADLIGGLLARISGVKNIYWNIRTSNYKYFKFSTKLVILLNALLSYFVPKKIISCSESGIYYHRRLFKSDKFILIDNGFTPENREYNIKQSKDHFTICYIARYHQVKNHSFLIKNLMQLKKKIAFKLILAGKNINYKNKELADMLRNYSLMSQTKLLDSQKNVGKLLKSINLFVLPSKTEGFPNILAEAMINRKVCLSSNVGDAGRILDKKFIYNNSLELKKKIIYLYNLRKKNKKEWKKIETRNQKKILKFFNIKKMVNKYKKVWKS